MGYALMAFDFSIELTSLVLLIFPVVTGCRVKLLRWWFSMVAGSSRQPLMKPKTMQKYPSRFLTATTDEAKNNAKVPKHFCGLKNCSCEELTVS